MTARYFFSSTTMLLTVFVLLVSCTTDTNDNTRANAPLLANIFGEAKNDGNSSHRLFGRTNSKPAPERRVIGTDGFLGDGTGNRRDLVEVSDDGAFNLNLVDVPITQAAKAVLGDALKKTYSIKPGVEGSITLQTTRALSERDLLETFQTGLELNGATMQRSGAVIVRCQGFWDRWLPELREGLAHLFGLIMRRICGEASAGLRLSVV